MKKYIAPELEISKFVAEDVIALSSVASPATDFSTETHGDLVYTGYTNSLE